MRRFLLVYLGLLAFLPLVLCRQFICTTSSNVTMTLDLFSHRAQKGSDSPHFSTGEAQPWPLIVRNNRKLRVVKYCYVDQPTRDKIHCQVMTGFTRWAVKLAYPASTKTGHNLSWEEASDGNAKAKERKTEFCHDPAGQWNPKVDKDTLVISIDPRLGGGGSSSVGYVPSSMNDAAGRHKMILGPDPEVWAIAHELGHVFGMVHEMQRSDRDNHVLYQCRNLMGYNTALANAMRAEGQTEAQVHPRLCDDAAFADHYGFVGAQYAKLGAGHDEPLGFDVDSIMLYPTSAWADDQCLKGHQLDACPILKWVQVDKNTRIRAEIPDTGYPSDGDAAWVKKWYPAM